MPRPEPRGRAAVRDAAARVVYGSGEAADPAVGATGGFDGYVPVPRLGPREAIVIELGT